MRAEDANKGWRNISQVSKKKTNEVECYHKDLLNS